jgi:hypothetical protein
MIEARSHVIRLAAGRIRVLRLAVDGNQFWPLRYTVAPDQAWCRVCGCTDRFGCVAPHCYWATPARDLCSRCAERMAR